MGLSTALLEIRIETPAGQSWPGLATLVQTWAGELQRTRMGTLRQAGRRSQPGCTTEADVVTFELIGEVEKLAPVLRDRLAAFQVPPSTVFSLQELTRDGEALGANGRYGLFAVHDAGLHPWGWQEQAMLAVTLTELAKEPKWKDLARRMEEPLPRFQLLGMGLIDVAALTPEERQAFIQAAERGCQKAANDGPTAWPHPERFPDWLHRYRERVGRWKAAG